MADLRWQSEGGVLMDGTGDIATTLNSFEEFQSMIVSRVKAAVRGWKLYAIGAGLEKFPGQPVNYDTELSIQRAVSTALTKEFLSSGDFTLQTIAIGNTIEIYVYASGQLIASDSVTL